jgi:hypothetical protein
MGASIRLLLGLALALAALLVYERQKVDPVTFALDPALILSAETWNGVPFTAPEIEAIRATVEEQRNHLPSKDARCEPLFILWLGNSQLHYVDQFRKGEHTAPYWVRQALDCRDATVPLGVSLPGANLQEHYVLAAYVERMLPVRGIVLELSFNDLREDGLRDEFSGLIKQEDRAALDRTELGAAILARAEAGWQRRRRDEASPGLASSAQMRLEDRLDAVLADHWQVWKDRQYLRSRLLVDLYGVRNAVLQVKATTARKIIPQRYERNMRALDALLHEARMRGIQVIAYIAPIRQDIAKPYDPVDYASWMHQVEAMTEANGGVLLNLEAIVPAADWGPASDDADFTHFNGNGHERLAAALLPHVEAIRQGHR